MPAPASPRTEPSGRLPGPPREPARRGRAADRGSGRVAPSRHRVIILKQHMQAGQTAERADGGWTIEFLEESAFTAIRRLRADGKKSQPYQLLVRAGWCRFSLAVLLPAIRIGPTDPPDGANGIDFIVFFRNPPAWSPPTPSGNPLSYWGKSPQAIFAFILPSRDVAGPGETRQVDCDTRSIIC